MRYSHTHSVFWARANLSPLTSRKHLAPSDRKEMASTMQEALQILKSVYDQYKLNKGR
jgi:hypothetical protein